MSPPCCGIRDGDECGGAGGRGAGGPSNFTVNQTHNDERGVCERKRSRDGAGGRGQKACSTFPATHSLPVCGSVAQRGEDRVRAHVHAHAHSTHYYLNSCGITCHHMMTNSSRAHFPVTQHAENTWENLHVPATARGRCWFFLLFFFFPR